MVLSSSAVSVQASSTYVSMSECTLAVACGSVSASLNRTPPHFAGGRGNSSASGRRAACVSWAEVDSSSTMPLPLPGAGEPRIPLPCASQPGPVPWRAGLALRAFRTWMGGCKAGYSDGMHLSTGGGVTVICVALRGRSASAAALRRMRTRRQGQHRPQAGSPDGRGARCTPCHQTNCLARTRWDALDRPPQNGLQRCVSRSVSATTGRVRGNCCHADSRAALDREIAFQASVRLRIRPCCHQSGSGCDLPSAIVGSLARHAWPTRIATVVTGTQL
jgi:hypothetical protein